MHSELNLQDVSDDILLRACFNRDANDEAILLANVTHVAPRRRVLALRGLARSFTVTDQQWCAALTDGDVDVRREALTLVSQERPSTTVCEHVRTMLSDGDALVVDGAAFACGEFLYEPALPELLTVASSHDDARCRESAIAALGAIGHDEARAVIIAALDDKPPVRRRAIVALANFAGPDVEAALERASADRDWQVRAAVSQLGRDDES